MVDLVEKQYPYEDLICKCSDKTVYVYECIMELANVTNGLYLDYPYYAKELSEAVGGKIAPAILTALINRGMLGWGGKCEKLNCYVITEKMYNYYKNVYIPTKTAYKKQLENFTKRTRVE